MDGERNPRLVYLPNSALLGVLLTVQSWFCFIFSLLGSQDRLKQTICTGLAGAASVFLMTVGRRAMRPYWPPSPGDKLAVGPIQAVWVTLLMITGGTFYWWMFED